VLCLGPLASRLSPLVLLPSHQSDWFLQFTQSPASEVTAPLYAGRRLPRLRHLTDFVQRHNPPLVSTTYESLTTRVRGVSFRSSLGHSPAQGSPELFLQRSPPRLVDRGAWSGLGTCLPDSRFPMGAASSFTCFTARILPPFLLPLQHTIVAKTLSVMHQRKPVIILTSDGSFNDPNPRLHRPRT